MAGALKEQFDTEHVLQLIQSFSKAIEHNKNYSEQVHEFLRQHNFNQLPHMAILLRNQDQSHPQILATAV